ncbi:5'-3' DNA helicase ZGRF1 [Rhinophrynus dorsalis]
MRTANPPAALSQRRLVMTPLKARDIRKVNKKDPSKLCAECLKKAANPEIPSQFQDFLSWMRNSMQETLSSLQASSVSKKRPRIDPDPGQDMSSRHMEVDESSLFEDLSDYSSEEEGEILEEDEGTFSLEKMDPFLKSLRKTLGLTEESKEQGILDMAFQGKKKEVFPVHHAVSDLIKTEWKKGDKRVAESRRFHRMYPFKEEDSSTWTTPPKVTLTLCASHTNFWSVSSAELILHVLNSDQPIQNVLYTHQKTKKSKVWQDGILKVPPDGKMATLYTDKGQRLENVFLKCNKLTPGDDLESDRYLITVEAEAVSSNVLQDFPEVKGAPSLNRNPRKPVGLHIPTGLKRKFMGFQGPREIPKKPYLEVEGILKTSTPALAQGRSSLPSQLYNTSPLFAAPYRQQEDIHVLADSGSGASWKYSSVTWKKENTLAPSPPSNSYPSPPIKTEGESITDSLPSVSNTGGGNLSQNVRSKAQILALLKSQSSELDVAVSVKPGEQHYIKTPVNCSNEAVSPQRTGLSGRTNNLAERQQLQHPHELVALKSIPMKSRWDVYLEQPPAPDTQKVVHNDTNIEFSMSEERQCFSSPVDFLQNTESKQEETNEKKSFLVSQSAVLPVRNHKADHLSSLLKTDTTLQGNLELLNCHRLYAQTSNTLEMPMLGNSETSQNQDLKPSLTENPMKKSNRSLQINTMQLLQQATITSSPESCTGQNGVNNNVTHLNNHFTAVLSSYNVSSTCSLSLERNLGEDTVTTEDHTAFNVPVATGNEELVLDDKITDEAISEVTFNLMDSFDFTDFDGEDSPMDRPVTQCASHLSESDIELDKNKEERDQKSKESSNEKCVKNNPSMCDDLCLHNQDKNDADNKKNNKEGVSHITENILCEKNVNKLDWHPKDIPFISTYTMDSPGCNNNTLSTGHDCMLQTLSSTLGNNDSSLTTNANYSTLLSKPRDFESDSKTDIQGKRELTANHTIPNTAKIFEDPVIELRCKEEDKGDFQTYPADFVSSNHPEQESQKSKDKDMFEYITENVQPAVLIKELNPLQEKDMQYLDEESWCNDSYFDSPELSEPGNSICLLKTLSKHSTALESLNILKGASPSSPKKEAYSRQTCTLSETEGGLWIQMEDWISMALICYAKEKKGGNRDIIQIRHLVSFISSTVSEEEEAFLGSKDIFRPVSDLTPLHHQSSNSTPAVECHQLQWSRGTQESSECDWDLSQWPSREENKVEPPALQESPNLDHLFFLRPRHQNSMEGPTIHIDDLQSTQEPQRLEESDFPDVSKTSRVISRLRRNMPFVTAPEDAMCCNMKQKQCDYEAYDTLQQCSSFSDNNCTRSVSICPSKKALMDNGGHNVFECNGKGSLEALENCNVAAPRRLSKWAKYQDTSPNSTANINNEDGLEGEDFSPKSVFGKEPCGIEEAQTNNTDQAKSANLGVLKDRLGYSSSVDTESPLELLTKHLHAAKRTLPHLGNKTFHPPVTTDKQSLPPFELIFPSRETVQCAAGVPERKVKIPAVFQSPAHYKLVFTASLTEHLNIQMFELSQRLHKALSKVDMSFYTSPKAGEAMGNNIGAPLCLHRQPAKLVMVKKEGPNKGRLFYTCDAPKTEECKFFKWLDEVKSTNSVGGKLSAKVVMGDMKSLASYVRCQKIPLYMESQLMIRKVSGFQKRRFGKFKKIDDAESEFGGECKTKLYLKLSRKESSSAYNRDDLWVVSKTLNFDPLDTFIACSAFYGPSANNDLEILPLKGYYPSNWPSNMVVHALLVCNASTELTSLRNIQEHISPSTLPLMPHLLHMHSEPGKPEKLSRGKFNPPSLISKVSLKCELPSYSFVLGLAKGMVQQFSLNEDQATALLQIAQMMSSAEGSHKQQTLPITIIHGVFGAGKSYLLAVVVLFLVQLFESNESAESRRSSPWKLLISSSTNVAVDRVLLGLLDLGFSQFIRVGSIRKIAKPVLPYSLHAGSENESEQLKELVALLKDDLTPVEKAYVRKSIEQHKLGTNKRLLGQVHVVGVTCAACPFACLSNLRFPVVILDECSQMTEPASMLPIARFQCEKLILVGDPKQLSPTIQGSEAAHEYGLEQTLFDRLCLMGHKAIMLRTQYRCHPAISAIANELFYHSQLLNGVSEEDRRPLLDWLPTLCFYNVSGTEQVEGNNSFHNMEEANFIVKLIQSLIASGIEGSMIGVITLYKSQMFKMCSLLGSAALCDPAEIKAIQVSTVDAFQGAEKEVIILSCVRSRQVGFIDSEKRMNVALTRGKRHLLIVGNLACLRKNKLWEHVIHHCERQQNGLKHVSQWEEKLNAILLHYQEKKVEEDLNIKRKKSRPKDDQAESRLATQAVPQVLCTSSKPKQQWRPKSLAKPKISKPPSA